MNATDFIKKMMDRISTSVEGISIKYAFEKSTGFHIVEVSPESIRIGNETYKKLAHQFRVDFHKEFPMEDIIISRVSELHDMSNVVYDSCLNTDEIEILGYAVIVENISCKKPSVYNKFYDTSNYINAGENNYALAA